MRKYAVKLAGGRYGPEFDSKPEAGAWGIQNLPADETGRVEFAIAYVRDGEEVGGVLVVAFRPMGTVSPELGRDLRRSLHPGGVRDLIRHRHPFP